MASTPPVVKWMVYDSESTTFSAPLGNKWDAGIVEAGSTSEDAEFYVWNNFGGSDAVADMINVRISVRDENGETVDKRICGEESERQATVAVKFWNESVSAWGSLDSSGTWEVDTWRPLDAASPKPINQASFKNAATNKGGTVSGAANGGTISDKDNYIQLKLHLTAKANADAGTIKWITRISYQYT